MRHAPESSPEYDTLVIGSGFGGTMVALPLVSAGERVLMIERGDWVPRGPKNWETGAFYSLGPYYEDGAPDRVRDDPPRGQVGSLRCVGGGSVFYGGATFRFRERDFAPGPEIVTDSDAAWPLTYDELEPHYSRAEELLGVAGEAGDDPTEPRRSVPFPRPAPALPYTGRLIADAARSLGLRPSRIPLAINFEGQERRCVRCVTCDGFACAVSAKGDLAVTLLPQLMRRGLHLRTNTVATRLFAEGGRITGVDCVDTARGERVTFRASRVVLSAGTLESARLLLASGLSRLNPGGHTVGRYLMRHCNALVYGFFVRRPDPVGEHHKHVAINDFYFGHSTVDEPAGKLGSIQQVVSPPLGYVKVVTPWVLAPFRATALRHMTGLLVIAEDQPQYANHVGLDFVARDRFGLPQAVVTHRYSARDEQARRALVAKAKQILREAGARFFHVHHLTTFSHALGAVRMGDDPSTSALDATCRFRGVENLFVVDGSFTPTSAAINPSLTIAANALRVGAHLAGASTDAVARGFATVVSSRA